MEQQSRPAVEKGPAWWLLGVALGLTVLFAGLVSLGHIKWSGEFQSSLLVEVRGGEEQQSIVEQIKAITSASVATAQAENLLFVEVFTPYTAELASELENSISGIEVKELKPVFEHDVFYSFLIALVGALVILGALLLVAIRKRRPAWIVPLTIGTTIGSALGLYVLVGLSVDQQTIIAAVLLALYMITIESRSLIRPPRMVEPKSWTTPTMSALVILLVCFLPVSLILGPSFFVLVFIGGLMGCLTVSLVVEPALVEKMPREMVKYHVSL